MKPKLDTQTSQLDGDLANDPIAQSLKARVDKGSVAEVLTEKDAKEIELQFPKPEAHKVKLSKQTT